MSCLPLAMNLVPIKRALTTTSTAIFVPFTTQELFMGWESIYYGLNALSNNLIMRMKERGQVLSRNSMGLVEAVMHCLVPMIHMQTMMEKDCFLQEVLMGIHIRQFYYPGIKLQIE